MELKVRMYVKTDKGFIAKIEEFEYHYTKGKRLVNSYSTKEVVENYLLLKGNQCEFIESIDYSIPPCYPSDDELDKIKSHIVKASYNIIDLIEVGDFLDNHCIVEIKENTCYLNDGWFISGDDIEDLVYSICTHEIFEKGSFEI